MILGAHIENYSAAAGEQGLILHTRVTIGYDAPRRTVHELLITAARGTKHVRPSPAPFVLQRALDDFYVEYELNAYTDAPREMAAIYSEFHQHIQDRFNEAGVEIMSPHYTQVRDGNTLTIPAEHRRPSYVPGALRVARVDERGNNSVG
jgi:small-conductance mechanosensitive channel